MDFLELFNGVLDIVKPVSAVNCYAKSLDDALDNLDIDSLDTIMLSMYFGEVYGVEEELMREMQATTVDDVQKFLEKHKTVTPTNVEDALAMVK